MFFGAFSKGDIILIIVILAAAVFSFSVTGRTGVSGKHAIVEVNGKKIMELPLDRDVVTSVDGPLGETVVSIKNGAVEIIDSPCPNHCCVHMGRIRISGEIIICVPNKVIVRVKGGESSYDGVTQ